MTDLQRRLRIAHLRKQARARAEWEAAHKDPGLVAELGPIGGLSAATPVEDRDLPTPSEPALDIPEYDDEELAEVDDVVGDAGVVALEDDAVAPPSLDNTKAELIAFAEAAGIEVKPVWRKADILDAILAAGTVADEGDPDAGE